MLGGPRPSSQFFRQIRRKAAWFLFGSRDPKGLEDPSGLNEWSDICYRRAKGDLTKYLLRQLVTLLLPITVLIIVPLLIENDFRIRLDALSVVGALLCLFGLFVLGATIKMFIDIGRGTLAPWDPTRKLVTQGLYAHVRNPMITGVLSILLGEALLFHSVPILSWSIIFLVINHVYFLAFEEPGLVERFGEEYLEYKKNVPRWLPRLRPWKPEKPGGNGVGASMHPSTPQGKAETRTGVMTLECEDVQITIANVRESFAALSANGRQVAYHPILALSEGEYEPLTVLLIVAKTHGEERWRLTLTSGGGGITTPDPTTALCFESSLVMIAGQFAVRLGVDNGQVLWTRRCDSSICWHIHRIMNEAAFIVHGELEITKLAADGSIIWQTSGKDIFTGPLTVERSRVLATDFSGSIYAIRLDTGESAIVGRGKPFPHE